MTSTDFKIELLKMNMQQKQLAVKLGITQQTVCRQLQCNTIPPLYKYALLGVKAELDKDLKAC